MVSLRLAMVLLAFVALQSCSRLHPLYLINNTGALIEVLHASTDGDEREWPAGRNVFAPWPFYVGAGDAREVSSWTDDAWIVEIGHRGCRYWYELPSRDDALRGFAIQIEADLRAHFVESDASPFRTPSGVSRLPEKEPDGYPALPVSARRDRFIPWNRAMCPAF